MLLEEDVFLLCREVAPVVLVVEETFFVEKAVEVLDADLELASPVAPTVIEGREGVVAVIELDIVTFEHLDVFIAEGYFMVPAQEMPVT